MVWIWEKETWPNMSGTVSESANSALKEAWAELVQEINALPWQFQRKFRNRMAGLEISASQAIENIDVAPGACEDALVNIQTPESGWALHHPTGGRDFNPENLRVSVISWRTWLGP